MDHKSTSTSRGTGGACSSCWPICRGSTSDKICGIRTEISYATLTAGLTCITKYSQPYSYATSTADVKQYSVGASPYAYAILGARHGTSGNFKLAALGDYDAVFTATSSTSIANENRGSHVLVPLLSEIHGICSEFCCQP